MPIAFIPCLSYTVMNWRTYIKRDTNWEVILMKKHILLLSLAFLSLNISGSNQVTGRLPGLLGVLRSFARTTETKANQAVKAAEPKAITVASNAPILRNSANAAVLKAVFPKNPMGSGTNALFNSTPSALNLISFTPATSESTDNFLKTYVPLTGIAASSSVLLPFSDDQINALSKNLKPKPSTSSTQQALNTGDRAATIASDIHLSEDEFEELLNAPIVPSNTPSLIPFAQPTPEELSIGDEKDDADVILFKQAPTPDEVLVIEKPTSTIFEEAQAFTYESSDQPLSAHIVENSMMLIANPEPATPTIDNAKDLTATEMPNQAVNILAHTQEEKSLFSKLMTEIINFPAKKETSQATKEAPKTALVPYIEQPKALVSIVIPQDKVALPKEEEPIITNQPTLSSVLKSTAVIGAGALTYAAVAAKKPAAAKEIAKQIISKINPQRVTPVIEEVVVSAQVKVPLIRHINPSEALAAQLKKVNAAEKNAFRKINIETARLIRQGEKEFTKLETNFKIKAKKDAAEVIRLEKQAKNEVAKLEAKFKPKAREDAPLKMEAELKQAQETKVRLEVEAKAKEETRVREEQQAKEDAARLERKNAETARLKQQAEEQVAKLEAELKAKAREDARLKMEAQERAETALKAKLAAPIDTPEIENVNTDVKIEKAPVVEKAKAKAPKSKMKSRTPTFKSKPAWIKWPKFKPVIKWPKFIPAVAPIPAPVPAPIPAPAPIENSTEEEDLENSQTKKLRPQEEEEEEELVDDLMKKVPLKKPDQKEEQFHEETEPTTPPTTPHEIAKKTLAAPLVKNTFVTTRLAWASKINTEPASLFKSNIPSPQELTQKADSKRTVELPFGENNNPLVASTASYSLPNNHTPTVKNARPLESELPAAASSSPVILDTQKNTTATNVSMKYNPALYPEFSNLAPYKDSPKKSNTKLAFDFGKEIVNTIIIQPLKQLAHSVIEAISSWFN